MTNWKELRNQLNLTNEEEQMVRFEAELIDTIIKIREEKGLSQVQLAELCNMKQPTIARFESKTHSPQIDSVLKILVPLGYTLQIVPIK